MSRDKINELVAVHVMGWKRVENSKHSKGWACNGMAGSICVSQDEFNKWEEDNKKDKGWVSPWTPEYSSDIAAALEIIEKEKGNYERIDVSWYNGSCNVIFWQDDITPFVDAEAETAPLAISLCALKAKGIEVGE